MRSQMNSQQLSVAFLMLWMASVTPGFGEEKPKQGAELLKVDVLAVLAHPDDETGMATALASLALSGEAVVANVYCTRGEGGGNMVGTQWGPALGILREAELRDCLEGLGVRYCFFLDQRDWAYTESMAATLRAWDEERALERLVRYYRSLRPDVVLTMDPTPNPGQHGHHQSAAILATKAFAAAADPDRFPEQLQREGLTVWQPRKLYSTGSFNEFGVRVSGTQTISGKAVASIVGEALSQHRSQGFGRMRGAAWLGRPRWFSLMKSVTPFKEETSFFDGLPVTGLTPMLQIPPVENETAEEDGAWRARLVPRPAITRYESWVKEAELAHIAREFLPDVPVRENEWNDVLIEVTNPGSEAEMGLLRLAGPSELQWQQSEIRQAFPPGVTQWPSRVMPSSGGDHEMTVSLRVGQRTFTTKGRFHTVPTAVIPRLRSVPSIGAQEEEWSSVTSLKIGSSQRIQGTVDGAGDSRAEVRVGYTDELLAVDVRVWDDVIVSNIASNDIRGHWRSDSVEICVDPRGGSEDTFNCYKIGIFPFVNGGGARAARDADARQGPIEETAPGTRVSSHRLSDGYRILALIPWEEADLVPQSKETFGFNVIVYDGDQADAAMGENINQSRIAWAARSGVQGRPEDWGRLHFD